MLCGAFDDGVTTKGDATELAGSVCDFTLLDGAFLPARSVQRKVWRLQPDELSPSSLSIMRDDIDDCLRLDCPAGSNASTAAATASTSAVESHDYLGKKMSDYADDSYRFHHNTDGTYDATFEFTVPALSGVYRVPFRMMRVNDAGVIISVGHRQWVDFCVADAELPGDKQAVLRQAGLAERLRHGPSIARTWRPGTEASLRDSTLCIAFSSWSGSRGRSGAAFGFAEFELAFCRAGIGTALFVRDPLRAWYLRGIDTAGHTFDSVVARLEEEIAIAQPARVVTVGASMGGYAAVRAGIALRVDTVLAFGPQVVLAPRERVALGLKVSPFDRSFQILEGEGKAEGFALTSLLEVVRDATSAAQEPKQRRQGLPRPLAPAPGAAPAHALEELAALSLGSTAPKTTAIQIFVGGACAGDVREAALLEKAIIAGRQSVASPASAPPALSCTCTIVPGSDHGVAAAMRNSGELQKVLCKSANVANPE